MKGSTATTPVSADASATGTVTARRLPGGWYAAVDEPTGKTYYYTADGAVTWERPTTSA